VRVGIEATGSMQWFVNLMEELGIECLVGHPAEIRAAEPRKQKHDRARCGFDSEAAGGKPLSGDLAAFQGATRFAVLVTAPSSVGTRADANTECAAVDSLGEWFTTRPNAKKRAVVAVARKLAVLLHRLWVSGEVYEPLRNSQKAMRAVA